MSGAYFCLVVSCSLFRCKQAGFGARAGQGKAGQRRAANIPYRHRDGGCITYGPWLTTFKQPSASEFSRALFLGNHQAWFQLEGQVRSRSGQVPQVAHPHLAPHRRLVLSKRWRLAFMIGHYDWRSRNQAREHCAAEPANQQIPHPDVSPTDRLTDYRRTITMACPRWKKPRPSRPLVLVEGDEATFACERGVLPIQSLHTAPPLFWQAPTGRRSLGWSVVAII